MSEDQDIAKAREAAEKWAKLIGLWDPVGFPNLTRTIVAKLTQIIYTACQEYATRLGVPLESSRPQSQWQELQQQLSSLQKERDGYEEKAIANARGLSDTLARAEKAEREVTIWISNANELQKQVNGWEPERAKLKAGLSTLREDVKPLLDYIATNGWDKAAGVYQAFLSKHPELAQS